ncbi:hypothetical protein MANES_05G005380v8 [Manihot esculenta]|nr:hypothetical protein MANES_05G005380v8 [Manihot esculenta]
MQSAPPNLPVGWRFHPTDFELLDPYLKNKRLGHLAHCFYIGEFELCNFNPSDLLPESSDEECYFFCRPEHYLENGRRKTKRKARTGFWKGTGKTISVTNKDDNEEIGTRKILVYHDPNRTKWVIHEYAFTAKLNLPFKGDFVLCKLHVNKKQTGNKKSTKIQPSSKNKKANQKLKDIKLGCKKGKPSKKARMDLSDCNAASASTFENQNLMTSSAYGEGEPHNHMTSDCENQNPNKMVAIPTHEVGDFGYQKDSNFSYGNPYDMSAFSTYNKGQESLSMTQTPYGIHNVSTCNKVETSCLLASHLEYQNPNEISIISSNEKCTPVCQWASGVEDQHPYEITTVSADNKDETSSLMDFQFETQNPLKMNFKSSYDNGIPTNPGILDFGSQNPSMNSNISVSEEGERNHLIGVPSYFENQNQYENTDNSIPGNYWSTCIASYIQDTTFQDVEFQHNTQDMSIFEGHMINHSLDSLLGEYSFSENEIFTRDEQEDTGCSALQQPIHNKENPCHSGFGTSVSTST